ncbi:related to glutathione S-transferase [Rhynchosporium agropyri]|uniref:glutathione transferase n=2 Tax=Rhynchosporium TaxID=38037 RepID=A0A1E1MN41_RHYSE|nr:related to glutathione S-transferase [Rhynchosporium agropyri]CZT50503.1 related to glutathione S-transferase [Rhynchosporium secalis]
MASTAPITTAKPKVILYWLEQSRSQRILWLLEELKVDYELKIFHRDPKTHLAPPELKQVHALGKSPVISVLAPGASEPIVIAESGFITEYLLENFAEGTTLLPKKYKDGQEGKIGCETEAWLRYKFYMHYAEGSLMTFMLLALVAGQIKSSPVPFFIKPITSGVASKIKTGFLDPNFVTHFSFLEEQLASSPGGGKYLCGPNLTGADILLSFPLLAGRTRTGLTKEKYPKLDAYVDMMEAEPGYKKAVAKIVEIDGKFETTL